VATCITMRTGAPGSTTRSGSGDPVAERQLGLLEERLDIRHPEP
jgi:hypothetical protein